MCEIGPLGLLPAREVAVLLAVGAGEFCQSAKELAQGVETADVTSELAMLCERGILSCGEGWTDEGLLLDELSIIYRWGDTDLAQSIAAMF